MLGTPLPVHLLVHCSWLALLGPAAMAQETPEALFEAARQSVRDRDWTTFLSLHHAAALRRDQGPGLRRLRAALDAAEALEGPGREAALARLEAEETRPLGLSIEEVRSIDLPEYARRVLDARGLPALVREAYLEGRVDPFRYDEPRTLATTEVVVDRPDGSVERTPWAAVRVAGAWRIGVREMARGD